MMRAIMFFACAFAISAAPATAERVVKETPRSSEIAVPVGGVVWEKAAFDGAMGVTIHGPIRANWGSAENVNLSDGSILIVIREKRLKACRQQTSVSLSGMTINGWIDCAIDKDGDGKFELISFNAVGGAKAVVPPVAYIRSTVALTGGSTQSFRQTITYLGRSGNDVRLSYREFSNDMARPAFTEDLTLPAPSQFPQTILVKDIKLTIISIDGSGLRYRLD